jgi:hypothetical protein
MSERLTMIEKANEADMSEKHPYDAHFKAAKAMDWQQVVLNGGPPCFHLCEDGSFCGRAERWAGHEDLHKFISFHDLLRMVAEAGPLDPDAAYQRFLRAKQVLLAALDEGEWAAAREYYKSKARPLDQARIYRVNTIAEQVDKHRKARTVPTAAEMEKWSTVLWNP